MVIMTMYNQGILLLRGITTGILVMTSLPKLCLISIISQFKYYKSPIHSLIKNMKRDDLLHCFALNYYL